MLISGYGLIFANQLEHSQNDTSKKHTLVFSLLRANPVIYKYVSCPHYPLYSIMHSSLFLVICLTFVMADQFALSKSKLTPNSSQLTRVNLCRLNSVQLTRSTNEHWISHTIIALKLVVFIPMLLFLSGPPFSVHFSDSLWRSVWAGKYAVFIILSTPSNLCSNRWMARVMVLLVSVHPYFYLSAMSERD